uniref:N-terminal Ras-GEF domain-containing protein n=1 Tax=Oryzias latipes TaxID=8090 RepID=A0A3P9HFC0_ORYLA
TMGSSTLGKAASIDSLLNEYIHAFDDSAELHVNLLPRTLLLMHRWYVPSAELAGKLLMIYPTWETHGAVARTSAGSEFTLDLGEPQHLHLCYLHLSLLSLSHCYRL